MSTRGMHLGGVRTLADIYARCVEMGDCWEWQRHINAYGVPQVGINGVPRPARRVAWTLANGPVPKGKVVTHTCGNFRCVNPAHARVITPKALLKQNRAKSNVQLLAARISATKRAQMGVPPHVVQAVKNAPHAHVATQAKTLGISKSTIYKLRKQTFFASPWAGLLMGARA